MPDRSQEVEVVEDVAGHHIDSSIRWRVCGVRRSRLIAKEAWVDMTVADNDAEQDERLGLMTKWRQTMSLSLWPHGSNRGDLEGEGARRGR